MSIKKSFKKFSRALNKKLVEESPLSHVPPFRDSVNSKNPYGTREVKDKDK